MKQPEQLDGSGQNGAGPAKPGRKPLKVLSTSLGVALAANLLALPAVSAEVADAAAKPPPKLVEWSTDAVKNYYDPAIDWNLALPEDKKPNAGAAGQGAASDAAAAGAATGTAAAGGSGGTNTVIVHSGGGFGGGFGWDDLLLYHLLFNRGGFYSTSSWSQSHTTVYANTRQPYQPRSYTPETFQNKPVAGSVVKPRTTASSGSFSTNKSSASSSTAAKSAASPSPSSVSSSGVKAPSTSTSSGSFSSSSSKSSSASSGSIGGKSSGFSSSSGG